MAQAKSTTSPLVLVAELTHRCPLGCPYCSNPLALVARDDELDAASWSRVFMEAAALGVSQVQLSGGEPGARRDLVDIAAHAREAGLYTNLITSGVGITTRTMRDLWEAGLNHVQVSFQDSDAVSADRISGYRSAFQRKHALAGEAVRLGLALTVSFVVHRVNIERVDAMLELALSLKANRIELALVRDHGWARNNHAALMPDREQVERAAAQAEEMRRNHLGRIVIDADLADDRAGFDDACSGEMKCRPLVVTPSGGVMPCHAARSILALEFWNVRDHALGDIWNLSPAFNAFRGAGGSGGCRCRRDRGTGEARHGDVAAVQDDRIFFYRRM